MDIDQELSDIIIDLNLFEESRFPVAPTLPGLATALTARDSTLEAVTHVLRDVVNDHLELTPALRDLSPVTRHLRNLDLTPPSSSEAGWVKDNKDLDATLSSVAWRRIGLASQRILRADDGIAVYGMDGDDIARDRLAVCARITSALTLLDPELRRAANDHGVLDSIAPTLGRSSELYASAHQLLTATSDRSGADSFGRALETSPYRIDVRSTPTLTEGLHAIAAQIDNAPNLAPRHVEELIQVQRQLSLLAAGQIRQGAGLDQERGADVIARMLDGHTRDLTALPKESRAANLVPTDSRPLAQAERCRDFLLFSKGVPFEMAPQVVNAIRNMTPALHRAVERSLACGLWAVIDAHGQPQLTPAAARANTTVDSTRASTVGEVHRPVLAERLEALSRQQLAVPPPHATASSQRRRPVASFLSPRTHRL